jgi:hypothetical protein
MSLLLLAAAVVVLAVLRGAGGAVVRRLGGDGRDPGLSLAAGYGVATLGVFGLALLRQVGPWALGAFLAALTPPALRFYRTCPEARRLPWPPPAGSASRLAAGLSLAILALGLIQALAPPTGMDSAVYHLLAPKKILEAGGLESDPDHWFHRTGGFYFIHLLGMGLGGEILAKLLAFGACLASAALAWSLAERARPGSGALGAVALCGSPLVSSLAGHEYLEIPILMYLLASVQAGVSAAGGGGTLLAGSMAGFAIGTKSTAFPALVLILGLAGLPPFALRPRSWRHGVSLAAGFVVPAGFWAAWNWASTGHPLYSEYSGRVLSGAPGPSGSLFARGLSSVFFPSIHYWGESAGPWVVLGLLGWAVLGGPRRAGAWAWLSLAGIAFYFSVVGLLLPGYLAVHSHGRYLAPVQLAFGIPLGIALLDAAGPRVRAFLLASLLAPAALMALVKLPRSLVAAPVVLGLESRSAYLAKKIETFEAGERLRAEKDVKLLFLAARGYYLEVPWVWLNVVGAVSTREELVRRIRDLGITHVIHEPSGILPVPLRDPALFDGPPFRTLGRWPGGVRLLQVE